MTTMPRQQLKKSPKTGRKIGLTFKEAVQEALNGFQVARHDWMTKWIEHVDGAVLLYDDGVQQPLGASYEDTVAMDWEIR